MMATRPVYFLDTISDRFVKEELIEFKWYPGLSVSQKQKSIASLHAEVSQRKKGVAILEISSKSDKHIGKALSAFNLFYFPKKYSKKISVEMAFQSSKVFAYGGPYIDLLNATSVAAKKDPRLKNSGELKCFLYFGEKWGLLPRTAFYDWLYLSALMQNKDIVEQLIMYDCFSDIEFNPQKSINCQARSAALFVSLYKRKLLDDVLESKEAYLSILKNYFGEAHPKRQLSLV